VSSWWERVGHMPAVDIFLSAAVMALIFLGWDLITGRVLAAKPFMLGFLAVFEASLNAMASFS
jgi:hypothetical protein